MTQAVAARRSKRLLGVLAIALAASGTGALASRANATTFSPLTGQELQADIIAANNSPGLDTILINPNSAAITYFPDTPMEISDDLIIKKGGKPNSSARASINGSAVNPTTADLFTIDAGVNVTFDTVIIGSASDFGFGVIHNFGHTKIERSLLQSNSGTDLLNEAGGTLLVENTTVTDNNLSPGLTDNGGTTTLNNDDIIRHGANGGVGSVGTLVMNNTVLAENTPNCFGGTGDVTTGVGSLDDDGTCNVAHPNQPALLGPVQNNNNAPTQTAKPNTGSPLINGGVNAVCPTVDQRYFVRNDATCDIGAYETNAVADNTGPTCAVTAVRSGPPKQQDVTATDSGSGLDTGAISGVTIANGTVAFTPFPAPSRSGLVITATKTDQTQSTRWSFDATDLAGNTTHCS